MDSDARSFSLCWVSACAMLFGIAWAMGSCTQHMNQETHEARLACIQAGGTWIGQTDTCARSSK